jgi:hypothetical protein
LLAAALRGLPAALALLALLALAEAAFNAACIASRAQGPISDEASIASSGTVQ